MGTLRKTQQIPGDKVDRTPGCRHVKGEHPAYFQGTGLEGDRHAIVQGNK